MEHGHIRVSLERPVSRERLEEHAAERIDVGRRPDLVALELLRGAVVDRPDDEPFAPEPRRSALCRDAEVRQEHTAVGSLDQDVGGLDVAMDDRALMDGVERRADLIDDRERFVGLEASPPAR